MNINVFQLFQSISMYFNVYVRISTLKMCMFVFQRFNLFQQFQRISTLITVQMNIMDFNFLIYFNQYQYISTYFNFDYSAHEYERISPISIYFNLFQRMCTYFNTENVYDWISTI